MRIITLPGVFRPISDSWLLVDALRREPLPPTATVLDLCTGSGVLAIAAAARGAKATAVDGSRRALWTVRLNARANGVHVRTVRGDLFDAVAGEQFDLIVSNPPYVPEVDDRLPSHGRARHWAGGTDGRAVLDRIIAAAPRHLRPGGRLLVVHSSVCGERRTLQELRSVGLAAEIVERRHGPLGPLMRSRARMLEARGLLGPGQRDEEVLVIRGRAPLRVLSAKSDVAATAHLHSDASTA